jgi:hypothetical protein
MSIDARWELRGMEFFLEGHDKQVCISVPDRGGQADMMPRDPAQLAWAEKHLEGIPGLKRVWNTSWEVSIPEGLANLEAFWKSKGGFFEADRWSETWTLGGAAATLKRKLIGTIFEVRAEDRALCDWANGALPGCPDIELVMTNLWRVRNAEGLAWLRARWTESGGEMGPEVHPWIRSA